MVLFNFFCILFQQIFEENSYAALITNIKTTDRWGEVIIILKDGESPKQTFDASVDREIRQ